MKDKLKCIHSVGGPTATAALYLALFTQLTAVYSKLCKVGSQRMDKCSNLGPIAYYRRAENN